MFSLYFLVDLAKALLVLAAALLISVDLLIVCGPAWWQLAVPALALIIARRIMWRWTGS